jgi:hypothetical protein
MPGHRQVSRTQNSEGRRPGRWVIGPGTRCVFGHEPIQSEHRPDHVFPDPFGLDLRSGTDPAVDVESAVPPRKDSLAPLLKALGMARRAEPTRLAGERQQVFRMAVRANADSKNMPGTREGRSGGTRKNLSTIGGPLRFDMLRGHPYRRYFRAASYIESTFSAGELSCSWWVGARA